METNTDKNYNNQKRKKCSKFKQFKNRIKYDLFGQFNSAFKWAVHDLTEAKYDRCNNN